MSNATRYRTHTVPMRTGKPDDDKYDRQHKRLKKRWKLDNSKTIRRAVDVAYVAEFGGAE